MGSSTCEETVKFLLLLFILQVPIQSVFLLQSISCHPQPLSAILPPSSVLFHPCPVASSSSLGCMSSGRLRTRPFLEASQQHPWQLPQARCWACAEEWIRHGAYTHRLSILVREILWDSSHHDSAPYMSGQVKICWIRSDCRCPAAPWLCGWKGTSTLFRSTVPGMLPATWLPLDKHVSTKQINY